MKKVFSALLLSGMILFTGCQDQSGQGESEETTLAFKISLEDEGLSLAEISLILDRDSTTARDVAMFLQRHGSCLSDVMALLANYGIGAKEIYALLDNDQQYKAVELRDFNAPEASAEDVGTEVMFLLGDEIPLEALTQLFADSGMTLADLLFYIQNKQYCVAENLIGDAAAVNMSVLLTYLQEHGVCLETLIAYFQFREIPFSSFVDFTTAQGITESDLKDFLEMDLDSSLKAFHISRTDRENLDAIADNNGSIADGIAYFEEKNIELSDINVSVAHVLSFMQQHDITIEESLIELQKNGITTGEIIYWLQKKNVCLDPVFPTTIETPPVTNTGMTRIK